MTIFVIDEPVAIDIAPTGATIPPDHSLTAPTLLRSQALALVYESVHRGEIDERTGRKILDDIRGLRIRFLGDRSLEDHAWRLAAKLNWPDIHQVEYIALTQLQADALVTVDDKLAAAARAFVKTASVADVLQTKLGRTHSTARIRTIRPALDTTVNFGSDPVDVPPLLDRPGLTPVPKHERCVIH